jgi:uncharacterized protein YjdB
MLHPNPAPTPTRELTAIEITTQPTKVTYIEGETFDPTGMVVTGIYNDSTTEEITNYSYSPTEALTTEDTTVTISYENYTTTQAIAVASSGNIPVESISFSTDSVTLKVGQSIDCHATFTPENTTDTIVFSAHNSSIVNTNGINRTTVRITGISVGTTGVYAQSLETPDVVSNNIQVTVTE